MSTKPVKFFYVRKNATNTMAFPVDGIRSFHMTDGTSLKLQIEALAGGTTTGEVDLTITEGKSEEVIKSIINAGRSSRALLINIADDVDSVYCNSNITAVVSTTE